MINKIMKSYDFGQGSAIGFVIMSILFIFVFFYLRATSREEMSL